MVEGTVAWAIQWAQDYGECGLDLMDVIQEGCIGLLRAAERFDHRASGRFYVYAWWWARQVITRAVGEQAGVVRLPTHVHERLMELEGAHDQLCDTLGREPSAKELAVALGLVSREDSLAIEQALVTGTTIPISVGDRLDRAALKVRRLAALTAQPIFLDATLDDESASADPDLRQLLDEAGLSLPEWTGHCIGDLLPRETAWDPLEAEAEEQLKTQMDEALSSLAHRERLVLKLRFGLDDGQARTLEEVGRIFGVTRERVRQIEARGLRKLRHPKRSRTLRHYLN
jgi:RNA polymerase primary sigma factor